MPTVICGDLHGRIETAEKVLSLDGYDKVFIGDYVDSYDRSTEDQVSTLALVLNAVENGECVGLLGNHEMSYLDSSMRASGWSRATSLHLIHMDLSPLKSFHYVDGFLITHAGVSQSLLEDKNMTLEDYLDSGQFNDIGRRRGGIQPIGGLYWCDWFSEFEPIEGVPQIVGHSGYRPKGEAPGVLHNKNSYNVDCLDRVENVLVIEEGKTKEVSLNNLVGD